MHVRTLSAEAEKLLSIYEELYLDEYTPCGRAGKGVINSAKKTGFARFFIPQLQF
jgi:hypothetical protein